MSRVSPVTYQAYHSATIVMLVLYCRLNLALKGKSHLKAFLMLYLLNREEIIYYVFL